MNKMKITINIETETDSELIKKELNKWLNENFKIKQRY
jgi:ribonuclease HI